tara:strand:- start:279 stop:419 length:141 start_codon:yes stop_codon:yes gene_type:complete
MTDKNPPKPNTLNGISFERIETLKAFLAGGYITRARYFQIIKEESA